MANQLLHYPLDRGIDQSKDTAASEPPTGLRECTNLWHSRQGVLSTRPGTARLGGTLGVDGSGYFMGAATVGNLGVALAGGYVWQQSRPESTEDEQWVGSGILGTGEFAPLTPSRRQDIGAPGSTATVAKHVAIWRHLMLVASEVSGDTLISAYDRSTGARLSTTSITGPLIGGWAHHADAIPPTLVRRGSGSGTDVIRYAMTDRDLGTYNTGGVSLVATGTGLLVCGNIDGSINYATGGGTVYYVTSATAGSAVNTATGATLTTCFARGYDGIAWFAGVSGGTLTVVRAFAGTVTTDTEGVSEAAAVLCMRSSGPIVLLYDSVSPTNTTACTVVNATGVIAAEGAFMTNASPLGGAVYDRAHSRGYVWFRANAGADSDSYNRTLLVRLSNITVSMDAGIITPPLVGVDGHLPQAGFDEDGAAISLLPERIDLGSATVVAVAHEYRFDQTRPIVEFLGQPFIPGGVLYDVVGESAPTAPPFGPIIASTSQGTTGALTTLGAYQFVAVYLKRDTFGVVRRSAPGEIVTVTLTGANDSVSLTFDDTELAPAGWEISIYRTEANGTIFYKISLDGSGIDPGDTYVSEQADTTITDNEILYTEGGVLFNDAAPSHSFAATGKRRMWLGGLWRRYRLQFSKEAIRGESPAFPDDPSHWLDLDSDVTGIACMDDGVLAFHRDYVDLISGDGPDATGAGAFNVRPVTIGIGCDDWRSVVVTPIGVFFAGNGTIWLMGRGFGAPENIGALVRDVLAEYPTVISSALVDYGHQQCVQFLCSSGSATTRLVFSLRSLQWYQWDGLGMSILGHMFVRDERRLCMLPALTPSTPVALLAESQDLTTDSAEALSTVISTHQIHNWGLTTDARIRCVYTRARVTEAQSWTMELEPNGDAEDLETQAWTPPVKAGYQANRFGVRRQSVQSIAVRLTAGPVALAGLMLEFDQEGAPKLPTGQKRG